MPAGHGTAQPACLPTRPAQPLCPPARHVPQVFKLESSKPRPERGLTVVTQLSLERFHMLENQCRLWPFQVPLQLLAPHCSACCPSRCHWALRS